MLLGKKKLPESQIALGLSLEVKLKGLDIDVTAITGTKLILIFLQG